MIAVWSKAALYVPERGAASTWVFTIARNLRIDRLRRESAAHFTDLEDFDAPSDDVPGDEAMNRSQEDGHVARALAQIPPEQRELLILSYVDDVPQSMIAERLNLPWNREIPYAPGLPAPAQAFGGGELTIVHHLDEATLLSYAAGTLGEALSVAAACHISMCSYAAAPCARLKHWVARSSMILESTCSVKCTPCRNPSQP